MASTGIEAKQKAGGGLSTPKIKLYHGDDTRPVNVVLNTYKYGANSAGNQFKLTSYPLAVAVDLTQDQIDAGVWIEMAYYKPGKSQSSANDGHVGSAYVIPGAWGAGANQWFGTTTRTGDHGFLGSIPLAVDRKNHYKVNFKNEVINVYEYLDYRFSEYDVMYRDITGNDVTLTCLVPSNRIRRFYNYPSNHFGYSGVLSPFYCKFRYVMKIGDDFQAGPWGAKVKVANKDFPFITDEQASQTLGKIANTINPNYSLGYMRCWLETSLP